MIFTPTDEIKTLGTVQSVCMLSCFSRAQLLATLWTIALPGSSVRGILQARILEWVAMPSSRGSSQPSLLCLLHWQAGSLLLAPPGELWWNVLWEYKASGSQHKVHHMVEASWVRESNEWSSDLIIHLGVGDLNRALNLSQFWFPICEVGTVEWTLQGPRENHSSEWLQYVTTHAG